VNFRTIGKISPHLQDWFPNVSRLCRLGLQFRESAARVRHHRFLDVADSIRGAEVLRRTLEHDAANPSSHEANMTNLTVGCRKTKT
jgi:hypothetical protein